MAAFYKFVRVPWNEKMLLLRAATTLLAVKAAMMTAGVTAVRRITGRTRAVGGGAPATSSRPSAQRIGWAVLAASRRIPGTRNCLVRALATEQILGRFGYPREVKIGALRNEAGEFAAHAWVIAQGQVVIGDFELDRYVAVSSARQRGPAS
jgi:hypothetical protein